MSLNNLDKTLILESINDLLNKYLEIGEFYSSVHPIIYKINECFGGITSIFNKTYEMIIYRYDILEYNFGEFRYKIDKLDSYDFLMDLNNKFSSSIIYKNNLHFYKKFIDILIKRVEQIKESNKSNDIYYTENIIKYNKWIEYFESRSEEFELLQEKLNESRANFNNIYYELCKKVFPSYFTRTGSNNIFQYVIYTKFDPGEIELYNKLEITGKHIFDTTNFFNLNGLTTLIIYNTNITKIKELPYSLNKLVITSSPIRQLDNLPNNIKSLTINTRTIKKLDNLPNELVYLDCSRCKITQLDNLPSNLKKLNCSNNKITQLDNLPVGLEVLDCSSNPIESLDLLPATVTIIISDNHFTNSLINFPRDSRLYSDCVDAFD